MLKRARGVGKVPTWHCTDVQIALDRGPILHPEVADGVVVVEHDLGQPGIQPQLAAVPRDLVGHWLAEPLREITWATFRGNSVTECRQVRVNLAVPIGIDYFGAV